MTQPGRAAMPSTLAEQRAAVTRGWMTLWDGTCGYFPELPRNDDCWRSAVATVLQVAIAELPDPQYKARVTAGENGEEIVAWAWREHERFAADRGLELCVHAQGDFPEDGRWILVAGPAGKPEAAFRGHALVMLGESILFAPGTPPSRQPRDRGWTLADMLAGAAVHYGMSYREVP